MLEASERPTCVGAHFFVGTRTHGVRNNIVTIREVVDVQYVRRDRTGMELSVFRFYKGAPDPITQYQGDWYFLGDFFEQLITRSNSTSETERR